MSRSQPTLINPAKHFYEWIGSSGELKYYDKEKEEKVIVKLPFTFMALDELSTISGYSDQDKSRFYSNEVRSTIRDELTVRTKAGIKIAGLYQDIKGKFGKYTKSVYIAHKDESGEYVIGNIKLTGASLGAWIELSGKNKVNEGTIGLVSSKEEQNGAVKYQVPVFKFRPSTPEENEVAVTLDKELQVFLSQYLANNERHEVQEHTNDIDDIKGFATDQQVADYEEKRRNAHDSINLDDFGPDPMDKVFNENPANNIPEDW